VERYARAVVRGDYPALRHAVADIRTELEHRRRKNPEAYGPRSAYAIGLRLGPRVRSLGWPIPGNRLSKPEQRPLDLHARRVLKGQSLGPPVPARQCFARMEELWRSRPTLRRKTYATIRTYLERRLRNLGKPPSRPDWTPTEDRVLARHARALVEGHYSSASAAARACMADWPPHCSIRRPLAVANRISTLARDMHLPRPGADFTRVEERILNAHTRAVVVGRYRSPSAAARACFWVLHRHYNRLRSGRPGSFRMLAGRTFSAVRAQVFLRVRALGRLGPSNRRWSMEESESAEKWLRRHRQFRKHGGHWTLAETARSLQDDLERRGCKRTFEACWLKLDYLLHGRPPHRPMLVPPPSGGESGILGMHLTQVGLAVIILYARQRGLSEESNGV